MRKTETKPDVKVTPYSKEISCKVKTAFRFNVGDRVWVRDHVHPKNLSSNMGGFSIVPAVVLEQHSHQDRHTAYPNGEGYALDGELWWSCYPGCRVFKTRKQAITARIGKVGK